MANQLEDSIRSAAAKAAAYVDDIGTMTVETKYVLVGPNGDVDFTQAKALARTVVKLDGDSEAILPMRTNAAGVLAVDADLLALHQSSVSTATEYRARLLESLAGMLNSFIK